MIAVTAIWGWTFVVVKDAISRYPTLPFLTVRFAMAAAVLILAAAIVRRGVSRRAAAHGVVIGGALAAGYLLQTLGLERTTPGEAGLLTGLFVVFTPILEGLFGSRPAARTWVAAAAALAGTAVLTGAAGGHLAGDLLEIGCAVAFAVHMVLLSRWAPGVHPLPLAAVQLATAALLFQLPGGFSLPAPPAAVLPALVITGIFASAAAFVIQTAVQSRISASRTALIVACEPAWALLFAVLLAHQRFGAAQGVGAALLLMAVLGHEYATWRAAPGAVSTI